MSEIEDRLTGGEDITFALAYDVGLRVRYFPFKNERGDPLGLGFSLGGHLTNFIGYDGPVYGGDDVRSIGASAGIIFSPR